MRKSIFTIAFAALCLIAVNTSFAQGDEGGSVTGQGSWLIEINTGFGEVAGSNTSFFLRSIDGNTAWGVGAEAGYFIIDDFALKAGLGYFDNGGSNGTFSWKFGGKYYIADVIPVGVDVNGSSNDGFSPMFVGIQAAYAWFVANNVSIEPGLRYGLNVNDDADALTGDSGIFSVNIGFNLFLN